MILHQSSEQGVIDKEETEMIRDVFRFSDKRANELMTHRRDVVILHPDDTREKVMKTIEEEHYSKYLLVYERKDEIIGVAVSYTHLVPHSPMSSHAQSCYGTSFPVSNRLIMSVNILHQLSLIHIYRIYYRRFREGPPPASIRCSKD